MQNHCVIKSPVISPRACAFLCDSERLLGEISWPIHKCGDRISWFGANLAGVVGEAYKIHFSTMRR